MNYKEWIKQADQKYKIWFDCIDHCEEKFIVETQDGKGRYKRLHRKECKAQGTK